MSVMVKVVNPLVKTDHLIESGTGISLAKSMNLIFCANLQIVTLIQMFWIVMKRSSCSYDVFSGS